VSSDKSHITTNFPVIIGGIIGQMRKDRGISQGEFAAMVALGQSTWSRIEKGMSGLSLEQLMRVAELLDVDASEILSKAKKVAEDLKAQNVEVHTSRKNETSTTAIVLGAAAFIALIIAATR
jgi:transcriptional regulator with XRE-family HTH domain